MSVLRQRLAHLVAMKPHLKKHILPLLKQAGNETLIHALVTYYNTRVKDSGYLSSVQSASILEKSSENVKKMMRKVRMVEPGGLDKTLVLLLCKSFVVFLEDLAVYQISESFENFHYQFGPTRKP